MNQSLNYEHCKQQTEKKLLEINELELRIRRVQQQLDRKKRSIAQLKQTSEGYDILSHHHAFYQQQLRKLHAAARKSNEDEQEVAEGHKTPTTPTSGKRDLAEILGTAPEAFSRKVEHIIEQQLKSRQQPAKNELSQLRQLFDRLPRNDNSTLSQFNAIVEELVSEVKALGLNEEKYLIKQSSDGKTFEQRDKMSAEIAKYESDFRKKMYKLKAKKEELEVEAKTVERQLIRRVRELHSDPAVQSALVKNMRTKSGNQQVKAELQSVLSQIEDMNKKIEEIERDNSLTEMEALISDVLRKINQKQTETQVLSSVNREQQQQRISDSANKDNTENIGYTDLARTAERIKSSLLATSQAGGVEHNEQTEEQSEIEEVLSVIKENLHPAYAISDVEALSRTLQAAEIVRKMSSEPSITQEIELLIVQLVEKWNTALKRRDLPMPKSQAADLVEEENFIAKHIKKLEAHIDNVEADHSIANEAKYRAKLEVADKVAEEVNQIQSVLDERGLLKRLGKDYTVGRRNFGEWLEVLRNANAGNVDNQNIGNWEP